MCIFVCFSSRRTYWWRNVYVSGFVFVVFSRWYRRLDGFVCWRQCPHRVWNIRSRRPSVHIQSDACVHITLAVTQNICRRLGARCSSVVTAFAHGAMDRRIDPSWWTHWAICRSSQCSTTGVTKVVYVLSCLWDGAYKRTLVVDVAAAGFISLYLSGPLPYVRRHITVNKMWWVRR